MCKRFDLQIANGNIDRDFATVMIEHHKSAAEIAHLQFQAGKDEDLRGMSAMIVEVHYKEIAQFQTWLLANRGK